MTGFCLPAEVELTTILSTLQLPCGWSPPGGGSQGLRSPELPRPSSPLQMGLGRALACTLPGVLHVLVASVGRTKSTRPTTSRLQRAWVSHKLGNDPQPRAGITRIWEVKSPCQHMAALAPMPVIKGKSRGFPRTMPLLFSAAYLDIPTSHCLSDAKTEKNFSPSVFS